jgi:hypothetical protein
MLKYGDESRRNIRTSFVAAWIAGSSPGTAMIV